MRVLLGWFCLFALCGLAALIHGRSTEGWRRERAARRAGEAPALALCDPLAARIVVGRPSGAAPITPSRPSAGPSAAPSASASPPGSGADAGADAGADGPADGWEALVFELTVREGQVLSRICEDFYGTGRPPLPARVAAYNGLRDEHSLRAGHSLRLPPREVLPR